VCDGDIVLIVDPTSLRTILSNLIDNAIKYSDRAPVIRIEARRDRELGQVHIRVSDRGIGIDKGDLKRIFQRFYRVPEEAVRSRHGTGLGLFVVRAMVRRQGGRVVAQSEGPGKGSRFIVTLRTHGRSSAAGASVFEARSRAGEARAAGGRDRVGDARSTR